MFVLLAVSVLFLGCGKKPTSIVEDYYNAKTWNEKQGLLYDTQGLTKAEIEDWLEINPSLKINNIWKENKIEDDAYEVGVSYGESSKKFIVVRKINDIWKIDIKATMGYTGGNILRIFVHDCDGNGASFGVPWFKHEHTAYQYFWCSSKSKGYQVLNDAYHAGKYKVTLKMNVTFEKFCNRVNNKYAQSEDICRIVVDRWNDYITINNLSWIER